MKIRFNIQFKTQWGESMHLLRHTSPQSGADSFVDYEMQCNDKSDWTVEISVDNSDFVSYQYAIQTVNKLFIYEYGGVRTVNFPIHNEAVNIQDNWRGFLR